MGKALVVSRSTVSSVCAGSSPRSSATRFCTCCSACRMSALGSNWAEISVDPRKVVDLTRRMPGTSMITCSIGRVTLRAIERAGSVPVCPMITTRGKLSGG